MSNNSAHITLLAPACFAMLAEPDSPAVSDSTESVNIDTNDAQARETATQCYEHALMNALGQGADTPGELPIAQHRYASDTNTEAPEHCVCAEMVHLQADTSNARLFPQTALDLSSEDVEHLVRSVNDLVGADGLTLSRLDNGNLYFTGMPASYLDTWPAHALASGKVANYLPRHTEAGDWRRLLTEVQMLFHAHPVNEARVAEQKLPINAMWFWGGQKMPAYSPVADTTLYACDEFSCGLAAAMQIECISAMSADQQWTTKSARVVVVELSVYAAWLNGDVVALKKAKQALHEQWIEPAQKAVASGSVTEFVLDGCEGQSIVETPVSPTGGFSSGVQSLSNLFKKVLGRTPKASARKDNSP